MKVSWVLLRVKQHRPTVKEVDLHYPMIALSDWASYLLKNCPRFILGGHSMQDDFHGTYFEFWSRYQRVDTSHPIYQPVSQ